MATTTNTGAKKIDQSEQWRNILGIHNDTVDAYDGHIAKLDESIAIVSDGNTHAAIAAGQYVYVKNHGTLTEGLYTANSAISANATLSSSNVTAVSGGGLNALNSNIVTYGEIETTLPSSDNDTNLTMPTGFNTSNCFPVLTGVFVADVWYWNNPSNIYVYFAGSIAKVHYSDGMRGKTMRIIFCKPKTITT